MIGRRAPLGSGETRSRAKSLGGQMSGRRHAAHLIHSLVEKLYPCERWGLVTEVRSSQDAPHDVLRRADAVALDFYPPGGGWCFHSFEVKLSRGDWLRELKDPAKSAPFALFCAAWWLVVAAPWKRTVLALGELPALWGLIEVGTGGAVVVHPAEVRQAEPPTRGFVRALLRSALGRAQPDPDVGVEAPLSRITRWLGPSQVGLLCGHVAAVPEWKRKDRPLAVPCFACAAGLPGDRALLRKAIEDATPEELDELARWITEREVRSAPACLCGDADAVRCAMQELLLSRRDLSVVVCAEEAERCPCRCPRCHGQGGAA